MPGATRAALEQVNRALRVTFEARAERSRLVARRLTSRLQLPTRGRPVRFAESVAQSPRRSNRFRRRGPDGREDPMNGPIPARVVRMRVDGGMAPRASPRRPSERSRGAAAIAPETGCDVLPVYRDLRQL